MHADQPMYGCVTLSRRVIFWTAVWLVLGLQTRASRITPEAYVLARGPVSQTETEATECTAQVGTGLGAWTVIGHPKAEACYRLRELAGRRGELVFIVEETRP